MNWQRRFRHNDLYASAPRFPMNNWGYTLYWVLSVNVRHH